MPLGSIRHPILPWLSRWTLLGRLAREAGWARLRGLALLSGLSSLLDVEELDEPTAFLDPESAQQVRQIIAESSKKRLVLMSTHDPDLLRQAHQVLVLDVSDRAGAEHIHHG